MFNIFCLVLFFVLLFEKYVQSNEYRSDYVYNRKTNAFYKYHMEDLKFKEAKIICENEGAEILAPTSEYDVIQVHEMFKNYTDVIPYAWIANDGTHHDSVEQKPIIDLENIYTASVIKEINIKDEECDIITRNGDVESYNCYQRVPFFCKVEAKKAFYDPHCMVFSKDYQYFESVGSCYKVPKIAYSWNQAYSECRSQGAHLAVLNSDLEHTIIQKFLNKVSDNPQGVYRAKTSWFFIAGIRAQVVRKGSPIVFKTIFNQTLEEAGYSRWSPNEPNNALDNEYCGTIFKNDGNYNDIECSEYYAFICEKEIKHV